MGPPTRSALGGPKSSTVFWGKHEVMWPESVPSPVHPKSGLTTREQGGSGYGASIPPRNPPSPPFLFCCVGRGGRAALGHGCSPSKMPLCGAPLGVPITGAGAQTLQHVPAELCPGDKVQRVCWHLAVTPHGAKPWPAWHPWVTPGASIHHLAGAGWGGTRWGALPLLSNRQSHLLQAGARVLPALCLRRGPACCAPPASPGWLPLAHSDCCTWENMHGHATAQLMPWGGRFWRAWDGDEDGQPGSTHGCLHVLESRSRRAGGAAALSAAALGAAALSAALSPG